MAPTTRKRAVTTSAAKEPEAPATSTSKRPAKRVKQAGKEDPDAASTKESPLTVPTKATQASKGSTDAANKDHSAFYLLKNEPDDFSVDDLAQEPEKTTCWEGVRNARARNILRAMDVGQRAFYYHSNCKKPGIVGVLEIVRAAYPDHTQFDTKAKYYDPKSKQDDPKWSMVDIRLERKLRRKVSLEELKGLREKEAIAKGMQLFTTARLSVQNITQAEWDFVLALEQEGDAEDIDD